MLLKKANRHTDMQIRQCYEFKWGMSMHFNEDLLVGNFVADGSSHVAIPILLNLKTEYATAD